MKYLIGTTGDGATSVEVEGEWSDLVQAVAEQIYSDPDARDFACVADNLANGIDGEDGWDGNRVHLPFEDGSLTVTLILSVR